MKRGGPTLFSPRSPKSWMGKMGKKSIYRQPYNILKYCQLCFLGLDRGDDWESWTLRVLRSKCNIFFKIWPILDGGLCYPAMGLHRPVAEISVNSIVHLTLYSFIVSGFTDALFRNVLTQAVLDPIFMALQKRQCPVFSCQAFLEYIYVCSFFIQ